MGYRSGKVTLIMLGHEKKLCGQMIKLMQEPIKSKLIIGSVSVKEEEAWLSNDSIKEDEPEEEYAEEDEEECEEDKIDEEEVEVEELYEGYDDSYIKIDGEL